MSRYCNLLLIFCVLVISSCQKDDGGETICPPTNPTNPSNPVDSCILKACNADQAVIKTIENVSGKLFTATIDGQEVAVLLNQEACGISADESFIICSAQIFTTSNWYEVEAMGNRLELGACVNFNGNVTCTDSLLTSSGTPMRYIQLTKFERKKCPLTYTVDPAANDTLERHWKFIGFRINLDSISFPPCETKEMDIIFGTDPAPSDPSMLGGSTQTVINGCGIKYQRFNANGIAIEFSACTLIGPVPSDLQEYDSEYSKSLKGADLFQIQNNVLTLTDTSGIGKEMVFVAMNP